MTASAGAVFQRQAAADDARRAAVEDARFAARIAARDIAAAIGLVQSTVATTAANPSIVRAFGAPAGCTLNFGGAGAFRSGHLDIVGRDGVVACSSLKNPRTQSYAGAAWLAGTVDGPVFTGPVLDVRTGKQVLLAAAPVSDRGAVIAFLDLDPLGPSLATSLGGPRRLEFLVTSEDGTVALSRSIDPARWVAAKLAGTPFAQPLEGDVEHRDLDGTRRLYGEATVEGVGWTVFAGADRSQALAAADRLSRRELGITLVGLLVFLLAVTVVARRIARPIDRLSLAVRAATAHGTPEPLHATGPAEVAALVEDFNVLIETANRELETAAQLTAVVESSSDAIFSMTPDGVITSWNAGAERMVGYAAEEVVGRSASFLLPPDVPHPTVVPRTAAGEHVHDFEARMAHKDGHLFDVSVSASPILDAAGTVTGIATVIRDITERNRSEAERRSLEERLHQSERMESVGQLAGGIAHDFNNLLGVIINYATFVAEQTAHDEAVRADVEQIRNAAQRAAELTRQLLIFGRREQVTPELLDLNAVVVNTQALLSRSIGEHVEQVVRAAPDLPAVRVDRSRLEQVLVNLAVNARDAMPDGGTLTIETRSTELDTEYARRHPELAPGHYVELSVGDTGTGISPEVAERIFEPFFTTKPHGSGTGLGLATVYGIVTDAGGAVHVDSELGTGTTFRVYLPAVDGPASAQQPDDTSPVNTGRGETVLVVEDEPAMLEVTARMLRRNGYVVLEAGTYETALSLAAEQDFDLLLTDSVMPRMAGREVAELVADLRPGRPVLFMSGYTDGVLGPRPPREEGSRLLQKPFSERTLLDTVRAVLADHPADT